MTTFYIPQLKSFLPILKECYGFDIIEISDELAERSDIINAIDPYVKQMRYDFITGKQNIDNGWAAYIKELKGLNVDRLVEINNTAYNRMK